MSRLNARASLPDKRVVEMLLALNVVEALRPRWSDGQWSVQRGQLGLERLIVFYGTTSALGGCVSTRAIADSTTSLWVLNCPRTCTMGMAHLVNRERGIYWYVLLTVFGVDGLCVRVKLFCALNQTLRCRTVVPPLDEITKYVPMRLWLA